MNYITFKKASMGISVVAALICAGGVATLLKSDSPTNKALALNIVVASGAIAIGNKLLASHYQSEGNYQVKPIIEGKDKEIKTLTNDNKALIEKHQKHLTALDEVKVLSDKQATEIKAKDDVIKSVKSQLAAAVADMEAKLKADDERFSSLLVEFKALLTEDLSDRIYQIYNSLQDSVTAKKKLSAYAAIAPQLEAFEDKLGIAYDDHCQRLKAINSLTGDWELVVKAAVGIYSQILCFYLLDDQNVNHTLTKINDISRVIA